MLVEYDNQCSTEGMTEAPHDLANALSALTVWDPYDVDSMGEMKADYAPHLAG